MVEHGTTFNRVLRDFLRRAEAAYQARVAADSAGDGDDLSRAQVEQRQVV
jgi:hypothetical protein